MIKSMTGFGKASCECQNRNITIEIKTLNSKQIDINARIPNGYRDKEPQMRSLISNRLQRGKIDFAINVEITGEASNYKLNNPLALKYYKELKELSSVLNETGDTDFLSMIVRMPDILVSEKEEISEAEWSSVFQALEEALKQVDDFRSQEGKMLENDLLIRINIILQLLDRVEPFEKVRFENLKAKILKDLNDFTEKESIDKNRFEQELVYYLEKLDITEEKVRLQKHCEYFVETMKEQESKGKKLIFISQEIGREINTLGSKANEANIQKVVVQMKDELEKIKEQLFNIL
jgi:uncharacterized protein (TIGR00255 family)